MAKVLTQRGVESAKPKAERYGKPDGLVPGLQLIVQPSGAKTYRLIARVNGKQVNITIGGATVLTLAEARAEAKRSLGLIAKGEDPREAKQERLSDRGGDRRGRRPALYRAPRQGQQQDLEGSPAQARRQRPAAAGAGGRSPRSPSAT